MSDYVGWTDERIAKLRKLWDEGLAAPLIAAQLGGFAHCTDGGRSSVLGKAYRLKLPTRSHPRKISRVVRMPGRSKSSSPKAKRTSAVTPPKFSTARLPDLLVWQPLPGTKPVKLLDLDPHHCRWPVEGGYCGCNKHQGLVYCETHAKIAYRPYEVKRDPAPMRTSAPPGLGQIDTVNEVLEAVS